MFRLSTIVNDRYCRGGTELETQKEALGIMGVAGSGKVENLLKLLRQRYLQEKSLLASLSEGSLAKAHQRLEG